MYFVVARVIWLFLEPSLLLIVGTLLGVALGFTRFRRAGGFLAGLGGAALAVFALTPAAVVLIRPLEDRFPVPDLDAIAAPAGIIILGGALNADRTVARARAPVTPGTPIDGPIALDASGSRVTEGLRLARRFPRARVLFAGGRGALTGNGLPEAHIAGEFLLSLGLPSDRLVVDRQSRNTAENAAYARGLVEASDQEEWILVTSASHMPRAYGVFEQAGFSLVAYPVDFTTAGDLSDWRDYTLSPVGSLRLLDRAVKEWIGLIVYRIRGVTPSYFPGPGTR